MLVICPVDGCTWETEFSTDGLTTKDIYAKAKALSSRHKRNSKKCNLVYCACSKSFFNSRGLDSHLASKKHDQANHYELTYCSVVSNNNHRVLNVESHNTGEENDTINYSAFMDSRGVVFGSTIGADAYDPPSHAIPEFLRAGTNVVQTQLSNRPSKKSKQSIHPRFGSTTVSSSTDDPPDFPINDGMDYSINEEDDTNSIGNINNISTAETSTTEINTLSDLLSLTSVTRNSERIHISSDVASRIGTTSELSTSVRVEELPGDQPQPSRRSCRIASLNSTNSSDEPSYSCSNPTTAMDATESVVDVSRVETNNTTSNQDFFVTHAERDDDNEPELNTGLLEETQDEIDIGWGIDNGTDQLDDDEEEIDLNIDPGTNNNITTNELKEALGNLTLDQEINGQTELLPAYDNSELPERTQEESAGINSNVRRYVSLIKDHRRRVNITCSEHMNYIEILVEMNRSNAPQSLFDTVARLIHKNFDKEEVTPPPTRESILSWVEKQVHPEELRHLSLPKTTALNDCPSGRKVSITHFNYEYQLALLLSNEEIMNPDNLLFPNKDDPYELLPQDGPLEDINSGYFHQKMTRARCLRRKDLLFPFVDFCDGTNVSRNSLEPYLRCPGIFNRKTRNKPESWFALGFFEPLVNWSPLSPNQKYETTDKLNDYHHVLKFLMKDAVMLEKTGFHFDLNLGKGKIHEVVFWPVTQLVLGDCKGADVLCGRFGSHRGTEGICRDCDCPTKEASNSSWQCNFFDKFSMKTKSAEQLKAKSFWKLPCNAFNFVNNHVPDVWGIFGLTPPEILHLFYIGLCVYLCQGFIQQRSGAMQKYLDASAISLYNHNKRQSLRGMPSLAAYRNGFVTDVAMTTGKEKFAKVFLLYLFMMKADIVE